MAQPVRGDADAVMRDAAVLQVPGAVALLQLVLELRVNRRTRRQMGHVVAALALATQPRWLGVLRKHLWNMYRLCLDQSLHKDIYKHKFNF